MVKRANSLKGKRLLVANRGEIVRRIAQTCHALEMVPVCFATLGEDHTNVLCSESIPLEGSSIRETFLNIEQIIPLLKEAQIDFVHPGYGFLSENEEFAKRVLEAGVYWIGPDPEHIRQMGSKIEAKRLAEKIGVSVLSWKAYETMPTDQQLLVDAKVVGYPLIVKASGGGGGKGMRIVRKEQDLAEAVKICAVEAASSFKSTAILLEHYVEKPRHLEVQIFGDGQGNVIHFYDRECSVQRRYQKIIEEAPVMNIDGKIKTAMIADALKLTQYMKYRNAGTVEFVYDGKQFYFIEVNTRLQVEHSVTEMITGVDLVELQIRNAMDQKNIPKQADVVARGYALEVRICAEDVSDHFMPQSGVLQKVHFASYHQMRLDSCLVAPFELKPYFDPMIAKISVYDTSKEKAITRMLEILKQSYLLGVKTNLSFLIFLLQTVEFRNSTFFTNTIEKEILGKYCQEELSKETLSAILQKVLQEGHSASDASGVNEGAYTQARTSLFEMIKL